MDTLNKMINSSNLTPESKSALFNNVWRVNFTEKPPTIEEFLTEKYIGPTALSLYSHVKTAITEFYKPDSVYRNIYLASAIGWGKSLASTIMVLYNIVILSLMKNPKKFFNISQATSIVAVLASFSLKKANQVLLQPFFQILLSSPYFVRVRQEEAIYARQSEITNTGKKQLVWSTASKMGGIQFSNDLHIIVVSDTANLLGLSIMTGVLSELSFFLSKGVSAEEINRIHKDLKSRIFSRFAGHYYGRMIVDCSPNSFDSPIDKYIFSGEASKDKQNFIVKSTHWDVFPERYPIWDETGETFPVFRGSGSRPAKILSESMRDKFNPEEILNVPIDAQQMFEEDLVKAVKDFGGYPSGSMDKLFDDFRVVDKMFYSHLSNMYSFIYAPANRVPKGLIWDQIVDDFFIDTGSGKFEFYRAPTAMRWIGVDQSEATDTTSIGMCHQETNTKGQVVIVTDFTISIYPGKNRINLDAIPEFIMELVSKGGINLRRATFDSFQSSAGVQRLIRFFDKKDRITKFSVDRETGPYLAFASWVKNKRVKAGRSIILRNNLRSLQEVERSSGSKKIDHTIGKLVSDDGGKWETSLMGTNAKDASDAIVAAFYNCINDFQGVPKYQWFEKTDDKAIKKNAMDRLSKLYGMQTA